MRNWYREYDRLERKYGYGFDDPRIVSRWTPEIERFLARPRPYEEKRKDFIGGLFLTLAIITATAVWFS